MLDADYLLVGGGLQNGLIALALDRVRPGARVALIEQGDRVGGNHVWCFHAGDVPAGLEAMVAPLVERTWPGYEVSFPRRVRRLTEPYSAVTSARFADVVEQTFARRGWHLLTGRRAAEVGAQRVTLDDGMVLAAGLVVDARGPEPAAVEGQAAYQKFVGLELALSADAPVTEPVLMDACVPQTDGYRFFYVLPFSPRRVLVEDTYFSDSPTLDIEQVRREVLRYAVARGLHVDAIEREEHGILPLPWRAAPPSRSTTPLVAGYRGGWFHPTTGYSFPLALRLAQLIAESAPEALAGPALDRLVARQARQLRFSSWLNRLLFAAFAPQDRRNVLERFYGLPSDTIRRFYAHDTTGADRARIVCGRPPRGISLSMAISRGAFS